MLLLLLVTSSVLTSDANLPASQLFPVKKEKKEKVQDGRPGLALRLHRHQLLLLLLPHQRSTSNKLHYRHLLVGVTAIKK